MSIIKHKLSYLIYISIFLIGCQKDNYLNLNPTHSFDSSLVESQKIEGEAPDFMFQLIYNGNHNLCQSVRINQKFLLTSAHCIYSNNQYKDLNQISLAQFNNDRQLITYPNVIIRAEIIPDYFKDNPSELGKRKIDLAVLEINPSRLPPFDPIKSKLTVNFNLTEDSFLSYATSQGAYDLEILSFQHNNDLNSPAQLRTSRLILDLAFVTERDHHLFYKEKSVPLKKTPCPGDSGAGVFIQNYNKQWVLVALTSGIAIRKNDANALASNSCFGEFIVFQKLAPFSNWINQVTGSN